MPSLRFENPLAWLLANVIFPVDIISLHQLTQHRKQLEIQLPIWLDSWYELEGLSSLATFAYLHSTYSWPMFVDDSESVLEAVAIGHPLLDPETKVHNDFRFAEMGEMALVSGSNMAGKSTFLRTVGINLLLSYSGTVVNADLLHFRPLRLFSCINVSDNITDGYSYFYAEVRRLKALLEAVEKPDKQPVFYLVDEIFRGTNNRERLIGSRYVVSSLVGQRAVGLISTHDLELVTLSDQLTNIRNYHFRDDVLEGKMIFDYTLHDGPSPTTNALQIMRLEGLTVPWQNKPDS